MVYCLIFSSMIMLIFALEPNRPAMNNLIDEAEFTRPYNPWKRFAVFYVIAGAHLFTFFQIVLHSDYVEQYTNRYVLQCYAILTALAPLLLGLLMLLGNHKVVALKNSAKIGALTVLELVYFLGMTLIVAIEDGINGGMSAGVAEGFGYMALYLFVSFALTLAVVLPVSRNKRKRLLRQNEIEL